METLKGREDVVNKCLFEMSGDGDGIGERM